MPSWSIHLKIGKEINKKLKLDNDLFMFGSLIPDTDNNWKKHRFEAHYYGNLKFPKCSNENMIDLEQFKRDYNDNLKDPMIIGYYCHLLTDNFYNKYIYYNKWIQNENNEIIGIRRNNNSIIDIKDDFRQTLKYKHKDLELYGKRIFNNEKLILPSYSEKYGESLNLLIDHFVEVDDVKNRINYLNNEFVEFNSIKNDEINNNYELFTKNELDELLSNCINYIENKLKEEGIINE